jgi:DNA-binding NarL/FixJ family response regulator
MRTGESDVTVKILLAAGDMADVALVRTALEQGAGRERAAVTHADCLAAAVDLLAWENFDIIVLAGPLPDEAGMPSLRRLRVEAPGVPVIVAAAEQDDLATGAMAAGARECLIKDGTYRKLLDRALWQAIEAVSAEKALMTAKEIVAAAIHEKMRLLASIYRDLRDPVDRVGALIAPLPGDEAAKAASDQPATRLLSSLRAAHLDLADLADTVRDLADGPGALTVVAENRIGVADVLDRCAARFAVLAEQAGVVLSVGAAAVPPSVHIDGNRILRILRGLFDEAIYRASPGGRIELTMRDGPAGLAFVMAVANPVAAEGADPLRLAVVPPASVECRPLALHLVEMMGGTLYPWTTDGDGSRVVVHLPTPPIRR